MKKLYIFALVATMFAACATDAIDEQSVKVEEQTPDTLVGTFEGDDSRIQLQNGKTVWTKGDLVSVFYRSKANQKWQYQGETGERTGTIKRVANAEATQELSDIVVVYPYNENYYINPKTNNVQASLPATQTYLKDSYGLDGNIMVSQSEYNQFSLRNVCGWLKIQLTGNGEKVQSIKLKGNNGEQVAGEIYINSADATSTLASEMGGADDGENSAGGNLVFDDTILTEVVLNCGEGVTLSSEPTAFYIALPPQTFERGVTVEIRDIDGYLMTQSTENSITILRNAIQPMAAFELKIKPYPNEIWYTSSNGSVAVPYKTDVFGANIVSNTYENGKGIIKFDGDVTSIGYRAFADCTSLTSVTIPNRVTSIENYAFYNCSSLTSITIPDSVTSIGAGAFESCTSLTDVTIGNGVTEIGINAFYSCNNLKEFKGKYATNDGRCLIIDTTLITYANASGTTFTIPDGVTMIRNNAFDSCSNLTSVSIPESVTTISFRAFWACGNLTSVYCKPTTPPIAQLHGGNWGAFEYINSQCKIYVPITSVEVYKAADGWNECADYIVGYEF